jgi:hypothetical protein
MHGTEFFLIEKKIHKDLTYPAGYEKGATTKKTSQAKTGTNMDIIYILPVRSKLGFVVRFCYAHLRVAPWRIAIACSRSSSLLASVCHTKTHCPSTASAAPMAA